MPTYQEMLEQKRAAVREVDARESARLREQGAILVDIREQDEVDQDLSPGRTHSRGFLEMRIEEAVRDRDTPLVVYCAGGVRSIFGAEALSNLGYRDVASMAGGFSGWKASGLPWRVPQSLTSDQRRRYSRHLLIPEVGEEGQRKLLDARFFWLERAGWVLPRHSISPLPESACWGLSTPTSSTNRTCSARWSTPRARRHAEGRIGASRNRSTEPGRECGEARDPARSEQRAGYLRRVRRHPRRHGQLRDSVSHQRCLCFSTSQTRMGASFRFEGQATTFIPHEGPCYRCLFPTPPPPELAPSCAEAGVLGLLPGTIGIIQATETAKLILGIGEPLVGRLLTYDALEMEFRELTTEPRSGVPDVRTRRSDIAGRHRVHRRRLPDTGARRSLAGGPAATRLAVNRGRGPCVLALPSF